MIPLKNEPPSMKLALFLCLVYVGAGVTLYPGWYLSVLTQGGSVLLFHLATTKFLVLNIIVFGIIGLIWFTAEIMASNTSKFSKAVERFVSSTIYIWLIWLIFLVGAGRLFATSLTIGAADLANLASKVEQLKEAKGQPPVIEGPVDFVFINGPKIEAAYDQTLPLMELEKKTVGIKDSGQISGKAQIPEIAEAGGQFAKEVQSEETYTQSKKSLIRKTVELVNYLGKQGLLRPIRTIEIQSTELSEFDRAVGLVTKTYKIPLPTEQLTKTRLDLIDKYLSQNTTTRFPINGWVELAGVFTVTGLTDTISMEFDYVPSFPKRVVFSTNLPRASTSENDANSLLPGGQAEIRLFGKLIHRSESDGEVRYEVLCLAVYR